MIESLPLFHRIAGQPVIVLGEGDAADAKRRLVRRAGGLPVGENDLAARLAFIASANPEDAAVRLRTRGILVNVVDRPDLCDFTVPALLDRAPVLVAFGTGGASAGLAKALRLRFENLLPPSLGRLARALEAGRLELRRRWPDASDRRRALDGAFGEGGSLDPFDAGSADRVDSWMQFGSAGRPAGVAVICLRSSDPEELTLREARLLGSADVLVHDTSVPVEVLERARADAARLVLDEGRPVPDMAGLVVVIRFDKS